jgi:hypothetical protein
MVLTTRDYQQLIHANPAFNTIFSAILLTKAVLFVGYSLNDPDFRLLLDRQLTVFRGNIPERYALMSGIGKVERDVLWRTARIRVLSYEDGKHEQMLEFLRALSDQIHQRPASEAKTPRTAMVARVPQPVAFELPPGTAPASTSTVLSIRLRGQSMEVRLSSGSNVVQGSGMPPVWALLAKLMGDALTFQSKARVVGQVLSGYLTDVVQRALHEIPADHVIRLRLSPEVELLPWEWAIVDDAFLISRHPVVRSPIGVSDSARGYPIVREPIRVLLIGDPNQHDQWPLPGALEEVKEIAQAYNGHQGIVCKALIGAEASFDHVAAELASGRYDVVHFAGHAWCNDRESFMLLSKGVPLSDSELRSLLSPRPPAILFLNSHYTIFMPPGAPGDEASKALADDAKTVQSGQRGFMEAALTAGVGALIGSFSGTLNDDIARQVGVNFHTQLLRGVPVARSLHHAVRLSAPTGMKQDQNHLCYAMSGYDDIRLPPAKRKGTSPRTRPRAG